MIKHILLILSLLIFGCINQIFDHGLEESDDELIQSIRNSSEKVHIDAEDLPLETQTILQNKYNNNLVIHSMHAPNLGYEITLGSTETSMGDIGEIYFNSEGRELMSEREDYEERRECFELAYPLYWSMPDGTNITVENENDWEEVREWYEQNPDADERYIQYPVTIIYDDETTISIASEGDLMQAYEECGGE